MDFVFAAEAVIHPATSAAEAAAGTAATPTWAWFVFGAVVLTALALDLFVANRRAHEQSLKEAIVWSIAWIALAVGFNVWVYFLDGPEKAMQFTTAYVLEKALSVDNLFVFLIIFTYFKVPSEHQHRVLFWGILGALGMRAIMIAGGVALLNAFQWVLYVFGAFLIFTGVKLLVSKHEEYKPADTLAFRLTKRLLPMTPEFHQQHFLVRQAGRWVGTPLLLVLIIVESTDVVFAVDSIPACLAVSRDPFIVYTSNIFAILGLRALFFVVSGAMKHLRYLKPALSLVLIYIGIKMCVNELVGHDSPYYISTGLSLGIVGGILGVAVIASLLKPEPLVLPAVVASDSGAAAKEAATDPEPRA